MARVMRKRHCCGWRRAATYPRERNGVEGSRGCAAPLVRATGYGLSADNEDYLRQCRDELLLLVQVESAEGVEKIPDIAAVEGKR